MVCRIPVFLEADPSVAAWEISADRVASTGSWVMNERKGGYQPQMKSDTRTSAPSGPLSLFRRSFRRSSRARPGKVLGTDSSRRVDTSRM